MYACICDLRKEAVAHEPIVDAPASVFLTRLEAVAPPRIDVAHIRIAGAPCVGEARREELGEFAAFFVGKAGIHPVGLGVLEVDFLMSHVHVTTYQYGLLRVECHEILAEGVVPCHTVVETSQPVLCIWGIDGDDVEVLVFQRDDTSFVVVFIYAHTINDAQRLVLGEDGGTGVALLVGVVPVALIALEGDVQLALLHLCLLQTEEISIETAKDVAEALTIAGTQAVDIP